MTDSYLAIAAIANDEFMNERVLACATQQAHLGNASSIVTSNPPGLAVKDWVTNNCYLWAASPSWGEKWASALVSHQDDSTYEPGKDESVITDADILSTVQALANPE